MIEVGVEVLMTVTFVLSFVLIGVDVGEARSAC